MTIEKFLLGGDNEYTPIVRELRDSVVLIGLDEIDFVEEENGICAKLLILHGLSAMDFSNLIQCVGERYWHIYPEIGATGIRLTIHNENFLL